MWYTCDLRLIFVTWFDIYPGFFFCFILFLKPFDLIQEKYIKMVSFYPIQLLSK